MKLEQLNREKLQVSSLVDLFLTEFNCGKCSPAAKSAILELLGVFFKLYPEDILNRASTVQLLFLDILDQVNRFYFPWI